MLLKLFICTLFRSVWLKWRKRCKWLQRFPRRLWIRRI